MYFSVNAAFIIYSCILLLACWQCIIAYEYCRKDVQWELCGEDKVHAYCQPTLLENELGVLFAVVPMTPKLKRELIRYHNLVRNNISCGYKDGKKGFPKASRMRTLIWDDELSFLAEKQCSQCNEPKEDDCIRVRRFSQTGLNFCLKSNNETMLILAFIEFCMETWFKQNENMDDKEGVAGSFVAPPDKNKTYKELAIIINEYSSRLGCGISLCEKAGSEEKYRYIMICNYNTNNTAGRPLYTKGDVSSDCGFFNAKKSQRYECLCTNSGKIYQAPPSPKKTNSKNPKEEGSS